MTTKYEPCWVPANNGSEKPFKTKSGFTLLYCWDWKNGKHAYLNCETDMILSPEEAEAALA